MEDVYATKKRFEKLFRDVDINRIGDNIGIDRLSNIEQIKEAFHNNKDISAHTVDFEKEAQLIRNQNGDINAWGSRHSYNNHPEIRNLASPNDSHFDGNETLEQYILLQTRSRS